MVELQPVDAVEVTLVVDNFVDILLAGADGVRRLPRPLSPCSRAGGGARSCTTAA
jgi:hypothetical protein